MLIFPLKSDWKEQENAICSKTTKDRILDLQSAQLRCLRETGCDKVMGVEGNEFHHTEYRLCTVDSFVQKHRSPKPRNPKSAYSIPNALYQKPG